MATEEGAVQMISQGGCQMAEVKHIKTIRDQVYQILRDDICAGKYAPGSWLQETELTEYLGVSRSPVREALRRLVADGLLMEIPNKGVFVKEFTCRDIEEIFDMRVMLESYAIQNSRRRMTSARLQKIFDILEKLERTYASGDLEAYTQNDEILHNRIVELSENSLVISTYDRVRSMNQQFRVLSLSSHQRFDESLEEHRQIVQALALGDVETACATNTRHLELACQCIKEHLSR